MVLVLVLVSLCSTGQSSSQPLTTDAPDTTFTVRNTVRAVATRATRGTRAPLPSFGTITPRPTLPSHQSTSPPTTLQTAQPTMLPTSTLPATTTTTHSATDAATTTSSPAPATPTGCCAATGVYPGATTVYTDGVAASDCNMANGLMVGSIMHHYPGRTCNEVMPAVTTATQKPTSTTAPTTAALTTAVPSAGEAGEGEGEAYGTASSSQSSTTSSDASVGEGAGEGEGEGEAETAMTTTTPAPTTTQFVTTQEDELSGSGVEVTVAPTAAATKYTPAPTKATTQAVTTQEDELSGSASGSGNNDNDDVEEEKVVRSISFAIPGAPLLADLTYSDLAYLRDSVRRSFASHSRGYLTAASFPSVTFTAAARRARLRRTGGGGIHVTAVVSEGIVLSALTNGLGYINSAIGRSEFSVTLQQSVFGDPPLQDTIAIYVKESDFKVSDPATVSASGTDAPASTARPATTLPWFFDAKTHEGDVVFMIDRSASVRDGKHALDCPEPDKSTFATTKELLFGRPDSTLEVVRKVIVDVITKVAPSINDGHIKVSIITFAGTANVLLHRSHMMWNQGQSITIIVIKMAAPSGFEMCFAIYRMPIPKDQTTKGAWRQNTSRVQPAALRDCHKAVACC